MFLNQDQTWKLQKVWKEKTDEEVDYEAHSGQEGSYKKGDG